MPKVMKVGKYHKRRKRRAGLPITLILLLLIAFGSLGYSVVLGKQMVDSGLITEPEPIQDTANVISDIELTSSLEPSSLEPSSSEPEAPQFGVPLSEGDRVMGSYFNDAVFFGDSVTDGISLYDVMSNAKVISYTGINPATALTRAVIKTQGDEKITMLEALKAQDPAKIYIMMGINSIAMDRDSFMTSYGKMLDAIISQHPDAIIYVQPITPITAAFEQSSKNTYDITNAKINDFNEGILQLAAERQVYYVNIYEALADESGALPDEASPKDGIHFGKKYYEMWFEYLKTHTAPVK